MKFVGPTKHLRCNDVNDVNKVMERAKTRPSETVRLKPFNLKPFKIVLTFTDEIL